MNKIFLRFLFFSTFLFSLCCNAPVGNENTVITMKTTLGDIKIRLYDGTPVHRDNFIKLVNSGFYEGVSFHRVINNFMIQAGDPATRSIRLASNADSLNTYTIPAEFNRNYFHKKGALAAAREGNDVNPEMRSSGTQFYIVQGTRFTENELNLAEQRMNSNIKQALFNKIIRQVADSALLSGKPLTDAEIQDKASVKMYEYLATNENYRIPDDQRIVYLNSGGVPRLDGTYTVFGEVTGGMDVVDKIAAAETDETDRPVNDIKILKIKIDNK